MYSVTCHLSPVTCHLSPVTCHLSPVTCHLSPVTCHLSPVKVGTPTCHSLYRAYSLYEAYSFYKAYSLYRAYSLNRAYSLCAAYSCYNLSRCSFYILHLQMYVPKCLQQCHTPRMSPVTCHLSPVTCHLPLTCTSAAALQGSETMHGGCSDVRRSTTTC